VTQTRCRILLADDHAVVREALRLLLEHEGFEVVAEASDGHAAVQAARRLQPEIAILDLGMPLLNGIDAARELRSAAPDTRAILLIGSASDEQVLAALQAGIQACVLKSHEARELIRAIREVARGEVYLSPGLTRAVVEAYVGHRDLPADPLTPRERQVLQLIAEGKATKETASVLGVSVKTVESHRARVMTKLAIDQTAGLVRYAIRTGLSRL
jgi:DNA-binding NarL/FixJ family response regulator